MTVFQRTPGWVLPRMDRDTTGTERRLLRAFPLLQRALRGGQALVRDGVLSQMMHRRWMPGWAVRPRQDRPVPRTSHHTPAAAPAAAMAKIGTTS